MNEGHNDQMNEIKCSICHHPVPNPEFAHNYPNFICQTCNGRAVNQHGESPLHISNHDDGDNPVYIDGIKCWRRYRFGGYVTMRDDHDCADLREFYDKHHANF